MHTPQTDSSLNGSKLEHGDAHQAAHDQWTRRSFMGSLGLAAGGAMMLGGTPVQAFQPSPLMAHLQQEQSDRVLVLIQLFGGNDGLNTLIPYEDSEYYRVRPNLSIPQHSTIPFGNSQGFHSSLASIAPMFEEGRMGILQSVGYPEPDLSHFRSTDIWLTGSKTEDYLNSGWVGRSMETVFKHSDELTYPLAVQLGFASPLLLRGDQRGTGMSINNPAQFRRLAGSGKLYDPENVPDSPLGAELAFTRSVANDAFRYAGAIQEAASVGNNSVNYPQGMSLGANLSIVARLIKGNLGAKIYHVVLNGFDTHANQFDFHAYLLQLLAESVDAFTRDLETTGHNQKVLIMTFSEFGRRVEENGSLGTDHGTSAPLFLFGPGVAGGVYGTTPSLTDLDNFGNLRHQFNFRNVYHTVLQDWFGFSPGRTAGVIGEEYQSLGFISNPIVTSTPPQEPPRSFALAQNYPNPFRDQTTITYDLNQPGPVMLRVYDLQGRMVRELVQGTQPAGSHTVTFAADRLPAGTYVYRLTAGSSQETRKMVVL